MGKEAGLVEEPCWDASYKIPKRPAPDTIAQGMNSYLPTLSMLSRKLAWCSFEAPGTTR